MSDAEKRLFTIRILGLIALSLTLSLARVYLKEKRRMESERVITDVELFLKATRLQELVLAEHQTIINELVRAWSNEAYRGPIKPITVAQWIKQNSTDTLTP